ncbi:protein sorting system archaetidylserine decarboxylase [Halobaculum sp. CBA1158]|uniref:protein sorting system archaetidylserine decarboxylase n=1 Tax=Halobaculum sp. CBA1158 TaxID=2904243 RepID=UPI001F241B57|nr:protein sorting system archaetidylserine decarboxylase [Halobaculum sp. CBA1158]UIO99826.1 protein sorting system archaetidylserine decarboxylase [Halobaculum sp. CBA1158]
MTRTPTPAPIGLPNPLPDLAPGSARRVAVPVALAVPFLFLVPPLGLALLALGAFSAYFYRDPDRTPAGEGIVAPADGHVSVIREDGDRVRVGVFMSPVDVHVCRAPADGTVTRLDHRGAAHRPAFAKGSERNERFEYALRAVDGEGDASTTADRAGDVDRTGAETTAARDGDPAADATAVVDGALIAGWFARRITPYVSRGDRLDRGDRLGYIAFGSRADVVLPPAYDPESVRVSVGEAVRAGESVIARRE